MSKFQNAIDNINIDFKEENLPSFHTTSVMNFKNIASKNLLQGKVVYPMKDKGVFLFYGKPSYNIDNAKATDMDTFPICLILNSSRYNMIGAFPFDSGRFPYYYILTEKYDIFDFELTKNTKNFDKIIQLLYPDGMSYYEDRMLNNPSIGKDEEILFDFIRHVINRKVPDGIYDLRSRTIEAVIEDQSTLSEGLIAMIIPSSIKYEPSGHPLNQLLRSSKAKVIYYDEMGLPPNTMRNNIMIAAKSYLSEVGLL